jgi:putative transposase
MMNTNVFLNISKTIRTHGRMIATTYGAAEPETGESFFLVLPYADAACMNIFLGKLSAECPDDQIILVCDGASWHKSKALEVPRNIRLLFLPPATPEMNPVEQLWKEIRKRGFKNEAFQTLEKVISRLCETIRSLTCATVRSITGREWIVSMI